LTTKWKPQ